MRGTPWVFFLLEITYGSHPNLSVFCFSYPPNSDFDLVLATGQDLSSVWWEIGKSLVLWLSCLIPAQVLLFTPAWPWPGDIPYVSLHFLVSPGGLMISPTPTGSLWGLTNNRKHTEQHLHLHGIPASVSSVVFLGCDSTVSRHCSFLCDAPCHYLTHPVFPSTGSLCGHDVQLHALGKHLRPVRQENGKVTSPKCMSSGFSSCGKMVLLSIWEPRLALSKCNEKTLLWGCGLLKSHVPSGAQACMFQNAEDSIGPSWSPWHSPFPYTRLGAVRRAHCGNLSAFPSPPGITT